MKDWKERIEIICRARKGSMDDGQFRATVEYNLEQIISERDKEVIQIVKNMGRLGLNEREKDWNAMLSWVVGELEEKLQTLNK